MMYTIFGDAPAIKILDWMINNQEFDHSMKEIADGAKISMVVTKRDFKSLLKQGVVKINRAVGRDAMYVLDMENRCTRAIIEFDKQIAKCCESAPSGEDDVGEESSSKDATKTEEFIEVDEEHERFMAGPPEQ